MTVSHPSQLINIHIISDDNLRRFQSRQSFSIKDSTVQTPKTFHWTFVSSSVEDLVGDYVRHLFAFKEQYHILPLIVKYLINVCVCFLSVCLSLSLSLSLSLRVLQLEQCRWVALEILPGTEQHEKGDREDGVSQISLRSGRIDWIWSACGHIVCARVNLCVWLCVCRVVSLQVDDTSYWTSGVMGTCSLGVPIGHLFAQPYCKHTHGFVWHSESPSCSVSRYPHSSP